MFAGSAFQIIWADSEIFRATHVMDQRRILVWGQKYLPTPTLPVGAPTHLGVGVLPNIRPNQNRRPVAGFARILKGAVFLRRWLAPGLFTTDIVRAHSPFRRHDNPVAGNQVLA